MSKLRDEDEIFSHWQGRPDDPHISICCMAFNHEPFIRDTLDGFLSQRTNVPFEILIHDDASNDGTADIIREYQSRYPNIIKPIFQEVNQYSQSNRPARLNNKRAKGKYIAICEGDDFWIDGNKLQQQFDVLEKLDDVDMCIHSGYQINMLDGKRSEIGEYLDKSGLMPVSDVVLKKHGQIPTASTFVRKHITDEIANFRDAHPYLTAGDIYLHFFGAKRGGAFYINKPMSVYRAFVPGSWTQKNRNDYTKRLANISARVNSYVELDKLTDYKHHAAFSEVNRTWVLRVLKDYRVPYKPKLDFYRQHSHCLTLKDKLAFLPIVSVPGAFALSKAVRKKVPS